MTKKHRGPGKGLVGGRYKPLTDDQVRRIHEASLAVLERTGVQASSRTRWAKRPRGWCWPAATPITT